MNDFKVRFNGDIVLETDDKDDAVARYMNLIALHPSCECAVIAKASEDEDCDEDGYYTLDAYSGPADPSDEDALLDGLKGNDQFWENLRTMGEAYWAYIEEEHPVRNQKEAEQVLKELQIAIDLAVAEVLVASGMWGLVQKEHE